jgi:hypothetical protein
MYTPRIAKIDWTNDVKLEIMANDIVAESWNYKLPTNQVKPT